MNIIVDLDLNQVVESWGSRNPAPPIQVKSQDTPTFAIYFARGNINYDIGTSPGLRFGLYQAGNPNALVQSSAFTRTTDAQSRVVYVAYPNFNTTAMLAAIGTQSSMPAIGELRYQTSFGTIARTLDIFFTILRSLLIETSLDTTIAAFTTPAVGSNVTVRINNTGWLSNNLNISIGAGAGAYKVVSITNATDFVAQNLGGASNAASGTNIPTGTSVGIAPPNVIGAFPDPSIIEVTTHKNVASGYAGLTSAGTLATSLIPVDTQTIRFNSNSQLSSSAIITSTTANFTTPAANATVSVTVASTAGFIAGQYVRIPIAGYYSIQSVTDGTHAVLSNVGDPLNAASGTTITSGAVLLPAQAVSGAGGGGEPAYTHTTASFVVPGVGSTVPVTVASTAWMGGNGYWVFITGAGYYAVSSITDTTHVVLTNGGSASNATPGSSVPSGATVSAAGPQGAAGSAGQGLAAYDALSAGFTMPSAGANVTISIGSTAWVGVGQVIYIATAGYMSVIAVSSATQLSVQNLNYPGNASSGASITAGSHVSPGGLQGAQGAGGAGLNAYTTLAANFTQPAVSSSVSANVVNSSWVAVGQILFVQGGGWYQVSTVPDLTHITLINLGYAGNAAPGATITSGTTVLVSPSGPQGSAINAFTTTTASFVMPAVNAGVAVSVGSTAWMAQGQNVYLPVAGYMSVAVINSPTNVVLTNIGSPANASTGTTIVTGTSVIAGGGQGQQGPPGPQGSPGSLSNATDAQSGAVSPEVSLIQAIASGTLSLKKLKAGTNVTLTDQGGTSGDVLINSTAGGAGGPFDPRNGYYVYEDFITFGPTSTPFPYWSSQSVSGTGASVNWNVVDLLYNSTHKALGYVELYSGSSNPSMAFLCYGAGINARHGLMLGLGQMDLASRIELLGSLPTTGVGFVYRFGLSSYNSISGAPLSPVNSIFLEYSPDQNSGNLRIGYNSASGSITYVNTTGAITGGSFYWWELVITTAGNVTAYLNGASIGTASAVAPLYAVMSPFWYVFVNSGSTFYSSAVDTLYAYMPYTR